jgi:hypothetical protein
VTASEVVQCARCGAVLDITHAFRDSADNWFCLDPDACGDRLAARLEDVDAL